MLGKATHSRIKTPEKWLLTPIKYLKNNICKWKMILKHPVYSLNYKQRIVCYNKSAPCIKNRNNSFGIDIKDNKFISYSYIQYDDFCIAVKAQLRKYLGKPYSIIFKVLGKYQNNYHHSIYSDFLVKHTSQKYDKSNTRERVNRTYFIFEVLGINNSDFSSLHKLTKNILLPSHYLLKRSNITLANF